MFRIGEFSALAKTTVKTLRFYEEEGLFKPARVDKWTGYRYYSTQQLFELQQIVSLRQAGMSISEIKDYFGGGNAAEILESRRASLEREYVETGRQLAVLNTIIKSVKENKKMNYQAVIKEVPEYTVYYKQGKIKDFSELTSFIVGSADECLAANPGLKCVEPGYCYVSYLDPDFKPVDMQIEYAQAVVKAGKESGSIKFKVLPPVTAVSVYHKGKYDGINEAYAFAVNWAKENGWDIAGLPRERYIDGVWNKENEADYLTEIQLPVSRHSEEVIERWGSTSEYSQSSSKKKSRNAGEEIESVSAAESIFADFAAARDCAPDSDEAKALVARWQEHITKYYYDCSKEMLACLGEMYVSDERFMQSLDSHGKGTAEFMSKAIASYCK